MPTIAEALGSTPHVSPLLRRVRQLGLATPAGLLRVAAERGCTHYTPTTTASSAALFASPTHDVLSDEELAIAMISGGQACDPALIRCAVQLLSGDTINATRVITLAHQERCVPLLQHAARAALPLDSDNPLWSRLLAIEARGAPPPVGRLPHPSRFMSIAGRTRSGAAHSPRWLKPRRRTSAITSSSS